MSDRKPTPASPGAAPGGWFFHSAMAARILGAAENGETEVCLSLDLGVSETRCQIRNRQLILKGDEVNLPLTDLAPVLGAGNKVFWFDGRAMTPVEVRSGGYYKLVPTNSLPTLEIDGVKMHRSKDIDPAEDARAKTALVVRPGDLVLDTCGGLGYSAIFAVKAGAARVVTTEKSREVLEIRALNPWTRAGALLVREGLDRIEAEHADIVRRIQEFRDGRFDAVIHDPPRFTSATGDLYGKAFYGHLARVLKPGGRLFHYTGSPRRIKNGNRFVANAGRRLAGAGFARVEFNETLQGLTAVRAWRARP